MSYYHEDKKSGVSPTGIVGTVLGATALAGVLSQNSGCGNGFLGGLFGGGNCNNNDCGEMRVYNQQKIDAGEKASTELAVYNDFIKPLTARVDAIETQAAITAAVAPYRDELLRCQIQEATCNVVRGRPMIMPNQIGEPYHGSPNQIVTRNYEPRNPFGPFGYDCGGCSPCGGLR